jgi:UDP-3-O-[3-hydroxymyristoyl] N-acetylglucosamine deacetylase
MPVKPARITLSMMPALRQHTLAAAVRFSGRGLHTGRRVTTRIGPAQADAGIVFRRVDRRGGTTDIPARWENAVPMVLSSGLRHENGTRVRTIEHLLAALYACGIDNAVVELDAEEPPILDGSSAEYVAGLDGAGTVPQDAARRYIRIVQPLSVEQDDRRIAVRPADEFGIELSLTLPETGEVGWSGTLSPASFRREIAAARTFARFKRAAQAFLISRLTPVSLCRRSSLANAHVLTRRGTLNRGGMLMPAEPARHRVLDLVGDLMLAGAPIIGHITGWRTAHAINQAFVRLLFARPDAWRWSHCDEPGSPT